MFKTNKRNVTENKKIRVVLVGPMPPTIGGITTFMLNLMSSSLAEEFDFRGYTTTRPRKKNVIDNYGYVAVFRGGVFRTIYGVALTAWRLLLFPFFLMRSRIDIVQVQASDYLVFWEGVVYVLLARLFGRPALLRLGGHFDHFYNASSPRMKIWIRKALRAPNFLIVQSQFTRAFVESIARPRSVLVLPNWYKNKLRARPPSGDPECPSILFIANMEAIRKGVEEVISAMQRLDAAGVRTKFHLCALAPRLIDRINQLKLSNVASMEGPVEHARLLDLMHSHDIFLLPSHGEGFPNSLVEAMAAGMASIATPVAGIPELVADGGAIIIPVRDVDALCTAIVRLVEDRSLRERLGVEARNSIERNFTAEKVLPVLADAYRTLKLRRHASDPRPVVLISAPSLDPRINVSGISAVVQELWTALSRNVRYIHVPVGSPQSGGVPYRTIRSVANTLDAIYLIATSRAKIFHSNTALQTKSILRDGLLVLVARLSRKRVLLHLHGGRYLQRKAPPVIGMACDALMRMADFVVFLSETERSDWLESMPALAAKSTSIYNSIKLGGVENAPHRPGGNLAAVFAGRLVPEKGIDTLLAVARADFSADFVVYGDGPLRRRVETEACENSRLVYGGVRDRNDWEEMYRQFDVLLLPSLEGEGMPMVMVEAMSMGVIPIATGIASIPEVLGKGERGIIVPPNDPDAILAALKMINADEAYRLGLRAACIAFARANFDVQRNALRLARIYDELCRPNA